MENSRKIFSKIYDQYIDKIYRFIFLKVSSQEVAEDLTSETFVRAWETFRNEDLNPAAKKIENPSAFIYQIARNLVIDHYRERGRTQVVSTEYVSMTDPGTNLEEKAILNSDLDKIKQALANIKEDYQNAIIWYYLDDLPISEVAKLTGRSEETTRVLISRALKSLREILNPK